MERQRRHKRKTQRKADKTGLLSWEVVDINGYCVRTEYEHVTTKRYNEEGITIDKNRYFLQELLKGLESNDHIIICDQGTLGSLDNALFLHYLDM